MAEVEIEVNEETTELLKKLRSRDNMFKSMTDWEILQMLAPHAMETEVRERSLDEEGKKDIQELLADISLEQGYLVTAGQVRDFTAVAETWPKGERNAAEFETYYLVWRIYGDEAKKQMDFLIAEYRWVTPEIVRQDFRVRYNREERGFLWTGPLPQ